METPAPYTTTEQPSDSLVDRRQKPWALVETELLRDPRISPQCKALYGLLITYGPQRIFPGQQTLADCMGTSRSTVIRWLGELHALGLIDWDNRTGTSNKYYILGYESFREGCVTSDTGGVAPVEQGCSVGDTGGVARVIHDLEPLKQEPIISNQGTEGCASAPPPPEPEPEPVPVKEEAPKAINAYRAIFHSYPRRETWGFIVTAVGERPDRLRTWTQVCTEWLLRGYNKYNVRGLIDCFHKGGVETRGNGRHDGQQGGSFIDRMLALAAEEGASGD